jgi:YD repeat-containing protein
MIRRVEGTAQPPRKLGVKRRATALVEVIEERDTPELALRYGNGFVTVEISHDALDAYAELHGDVPLPVYEDQENGDRRTFDAKTRVRLVYDAQARLREVTTRGRDGVYVRLTVSDAPPADEPDVADADVADDATPQVQLNAGESDVHD